MTRSLDSRPTARPSTATPTGLRQRLADLRGPAVAPHPLDARALAALAANPGCHRRALLDGAGIDKGALARALGSPATFGQSQFAFVRGNAFEARVKDDGGAELIRLLRERLGEGPQEPDPAPAPDLSAVGPEGRVARTALALRDATAAGRWTLLDHPLLALPVAGTPVYLEPDAVVVHPDGSWTVVEIKSFAMIDGAADTAKVGAAARQAAVYALALEDVAARLPAPVPSGRGDDEDGPVARPLERGDSAVDTTGAHTRPDARVGVADLPLIRRGDADTGAEPLPADRETTSAQPHGHQDHTVGETGAPTSVDARAGATGLPPAPQGHTGGRPEARPDARLSTANRPPAHQEHTGTWPEARPDATATRHPAVMDGAGFGHPEDAPATGRARVRHHILLVCPKDFSNLPAAELVDVRKQLATTRRQLARLTRVEDIAATLPAGTTFDLRLADDGRTATRPAAELATAVESVGAAYAPECLAACELAFHCRARARAAGAVETLGRGVRGELGALTTVESVLSAALGETGDPADPTVSALRRAAALRAEALGASEGCPPGHTAHRTEAACH
ncbi:hypothetical protein [Streptomyces syringium]|uniref:hypothetical protein n=1 Tax=Streptomyces syringium TaxID=76729 RepID=UPI0037D76393